MNLKFITSTTAGSDITTLAVDNCFSASYSHYRIYLTNLNSYGFVYYHGNLRDGSGAVSGTNYIQQSLQKFGNTSSGGGQGFYYNGIRTDLDYMQYVGGQGINSYQNTIHAEYEIYMPFESDKHTFIAGKGNSSQGQYQIFTNQGNYTYPVATSITGFEVYSSSSNKIYTGTKLSVYGIPQ